MWSPGGGDTSFLNSTNMNEPVLLAAKHVHLSASEVGLRQWGYATNTYSTGIKRVNVCKCFFLPIDKKHSPTGLFVVINIQQ